jgi:hypothetical protein
MSNVSPLLVARPWKLSPYQEADPRSSYAYEESSTR